MPDNELRIEMKLMLIEECEASRSPSPRVRRIFARDRSTSVAWLILTVTGANHVDKASFTPRNSESLISYLPAILVVDSESRWWESWATLV